MTRVLLVVTTLLCCLVLETDSIFVKAQPPASQRPVLRLQSAQATIDATTAWNMVCADWGFPAAPVANPRATFASVWPTGSGDYPLNINVALVGVMADVSELLGWPPPPPIGGDEFNATIQSWD